MTVQLNINVGTNNPEIGKTLREAVESILELEKDRDDNLTYSIDSSFVTHVNPRYIGPRRYQPVDES